MAYTFSVSVAVQGADQVQRDLGAAVARIQDLRPAWPQVYAAWRAQERELFATQGRSADLAWPRLSPGYAAWKARRFPGKTLLRRTDRLYDSLTASAYPDQVYAAGPAWLKMGTKVPYAAYHQRGDIGAQRSGRPRREMVLITGTTLSQVAAHVHAYLWRERAPSS